MAQAERQDAGAGSAPESSVARDSLSVAGLTKAFGRTPVLHDISFRLGGRESVALIGANGCGKSTLLRCCLRLAEPDDGRVTLLGEDVRSLRSGPLRRLRAKVGFVFQKHNLVPRLSVLSNVIHGVQGRDGGPRSWFHELATEDMRREAMTCLARVGLADLAVRRADQLSGGQSQRVAIARALMQRPRIVFADEPVASLDPRAGEAVMELFSDLMRQEELTVFFTSHDLRHAVTYADRILGLRNGRVALDVSAAGQPVRELRALYV